LKGIKTILTHSTVALLPNLINQIMDFTIAINKCNLL
jgi:hypothetical protein